MQPSQRRWGLAVAVASLIASGRVGAQPARGDGDAVEATIKRGIELRKQRQDEAALEEFRRAYQLSRGARALAQIGLAEQALGRWVEAESHVQEALQSSTDPWIQKNREALQSSLVAIARHVGSLQVLGSPGGAEVRVQGTKVGVLPMDRSVRVPTGDVVIEVMRPGYRPVSRTVNVSATQMARETVLLVPVLADGGAPPPPAAPEARAAAPAPARPPESMRRTDATAAGPSAWRRGLTWGAAGLGAGALAVGVAETVIAVRRSRTFNSLPDECMDDGSGNILGGARCEAVAHEQTVATWTAAVAFGVGGALAATALVLHLSQPAPAAGRLAVIRCGGSVTNWGVTCLGRF